MTALNELMQTTLTTQQVRTVDRIAIEEFGVNSLVLMENAALGCVHWLLREKQTPNSTVILCGRGNNGGDGLVIARHLQLQGWNCQAFVQGPIAKLSEDNRSNLQILESNDVESSQQDRVVSIVDEDLAPSLQAISQADLIIDAMLGSGVCGDPRPPFDRWISAANASQAFRLAIDVPTGVSADSGQLAKPSFDAHATLTFVAPKPAMTRDETKANFGDLTVIPIGIPQRLVRRLLRDFQATA
jgi:NAD(P)H-hydrate epimerase